VSLRSNFNWLGEDLVLAIHEAQIAQHGGASGVRDLGLLASALARPKQAATFAHPTVPELAALYTLGIIKNHPFVDGNKRVGTVLLDVFLEDHGYEVVVSDEELLSTVVALAAGKMSEETFVAWVTERTREM